MATESSAQRRPKRRSISASSRGTATGRPWGHVGAQGMASSASRSAPAARADRARRPSGGRCGRPASRTWIGRRRRASATRALGGAAALPCERARPPARAPAPPDRGRRAAPARAHASTVSLAEGSTSKPSRSSLVGVLGSSAANARRIQLDRHGREQPLPLDALRSSHSRAALVEHALVGGVLVDQQQPVLAPRGPGRWRGAARAAQLPESAADANARERPLGARRRSVRTPDRP